LIYSLSLFSLAKNHTFRAVIFTELKSESKLKKEKNFQIKEIASSDTLNLRQMNLRREQKAEELVFPGDSDSSTVHFGIFYEGELCGIASIYNEPMKDETNDYSWRLRGMATNEEVRGLGFGMELMYKCISHVKLNKGRIFWCNARTSAEGFYEKFGMKRKGEVFYPEGLGEHVVMTMQIEDNR
jgi:predicted GNAT family N-acyltransferase